jgi:uncharacterized membrane protein
LVDIGVPYDLIGQIGRTLQPGRAAVFFLGRDAAMERIVEAIQPYNPTVIQTSLSRDTKRELIQQLQQNHPVGASRPNS